MFFRRTAEERAEILARLARNHAFREQKRKDFNQKYRRSLIYLSSWAARVLFLLWLGFIFFFDGGSRGFKEQVVRMADVERIAAIRGQVIHQLTIHTDQEVLVSRFEFPNYPMLRNGDTILVEKNLFNKSSNFTRKSWEKKYPVALNWVAYVLVLILVFASMLFNDGTDRVTDWVLLASWIATLWAMGDYFFAGSFA